MCDSGKIKKLWERVILLGLLLIFFAQAVAAIPQLSLTADEPVYMGTGYALLRTNDRRMSIAAQHPPLMQILASAPLLLAPGPDVTTLPGWSTAEMARFAPAFVAWYGDRLRLDEATFAARLPTVLLAMVWAAVLFRWAGDWFGARAGVIALAWFVFDPNVLAHAPLATNDVGFAAFSFIATFFAARYARRPTRAYFLLTGLALGGSVSAKSSGFFTALVIAALLFFSALLGDAASRRERFGRFGLALVGMLLIGGGVLWASYGFEHRPELLATHRAIWREMQAHLAGGHTAYLMGEIRETGWRLYYPITFGVKTPLPVLALALVGAIHAVSAGLRYWRKTLPMWIYVGGYGAATLLSNVSTGYRFLLPILPYLYLEIAHVVKQQIDKVTNLQNIKATKQQNDKGLAFYALRTTHYALRITFFSLLLWHILATILIAPHYLTYFNALVGGPDGGHRYLVDSNLDWGQAFKSLRAYLEEQREPGAPEVRLSTYTYADPRLYGIDYEPLPPDTEAPPILPGRFNPAPGLYAISATPLHGVMLIDPDTYSWFRRRQPMARPGNAIFVYRVTAPALRPTWVAQCSQPTPPLSAEIIAEGFRRADLRRVTFDCTQSWLYPDGGASAGWYVLHREVAPEGQPFIQARLAAARRSYVQRSDREAPAFSIYAQPAGSDASRPTLAITRPLDGPLTFLGASLPPAGVLIRPGETVEITTFWEVTRVPTRPLSLMLHLAGPAETNLVGDGLGVPPTEWRVGDVIAQRHTFALPGDAPSGAYTPISGAYWLDTMTRWPVTSARAEADDHIPLPALQVGAE